MLARLARTLPTDGYLYEPKWDGFRCLAFIDRGEVDLRSRHERPFSRYFPEIVEALAALPLTDAVLDGELVVVVNGRFDFAALMGRLHPAASRVQRLRQEAPAGYVGFDLLAASGVEWIERPFAERRRELENAMGAAAPPLFVTEITDDVAKAQDWLDQFQGAGVDGVVAKHADLRYQPGVRAMVKVKREHTADCVVAGFRPTLDRRGAVASLLLGLYDDERRLHHVGVVVGLPKAQREEAFALLRPQVVPLDEHPWSAGFLLEGGALGRLRGSAGRWTPEMTLDWIPVAPKLVCEVAFDQVDGRRLRHPARFRRWRPDRDADSCHIDQIATVPEVLPQLLDLS
jgi:ATP-dependent DNA ligase